MNPIDQAFVNAYAKKRPAAPISTDSSPVQTKPLTDPTGSNSLRVETPIQSYQPPRPHFDPASIPPAILSSSVRSPSIVVPFEEPKASGPTSTQPQIRLRIDRTANSQPVVPGPKSKLPPMPTAEPTSAGNSAPSPRRTLTSYLQQARQTSVPEKVSTVQPVIAPSLPKVVSPSSTKVPTVTSRWSTPPNAAPQAYRFDPQHAIQPPVNRPEDISPWSFQSVERGTKATADTNSVSARMLNPSQPTEDLYFGARSTPTDPPESRRLPNGSFGPHFPIPGQATEAKDSVAAKRQPSPIEAIQTQETQDLRPASPAPENSTFSQREPHFQSQSRFAQAEKTLESAAKVALPIQSLWEVDQFFWPATVSSLIESQPDAFHEIGLHFQHMQSKGLRVLTVTSGERGVGRSTVAMCVAKCVAKLGLRVALMDGDYECPSLIDQLNMAVDHGWQECLTGNVPLDEVVVQSLEDNVALVPLTDSISGSIVNEQIARANKLIKRLSIAYDFVVIDGNRLTQKHPRLLGTGEDAVLDAALVIVDAELSLRQRVDTAIDLIRQQGIQSIGLAENFHTETSR